MDVKVNAQSENNTKLVQALERGYTLVHERMIKIWLHPDFVYDRTATGKEQEETKQYVRNFLSNAIEKKRAEIRGRSKNIEFNSSKIPRKCTMEHLLEMVEEDPTVMTEKELIDEAFILFTASEDTTSINYAFSMMMLGMYPEIQEKVYREIKEVLGEKVLYDLEDLGNLKYTEMVIKESLRLIPIGPFILRRVTEPFDLENHVLPVGSTCVVNIYSIQRDPKEWEKPNDFYPDHHLPEATEKRHPYAFVPFSNGPRSCVGKQYAMLLIKTMLAKTLLRYRVEADGKFPDLFIYCDISCRVEGGCSLRLFNR